MEYRPIGISSPQCMVKGKMMEVAKFIKFNIFSFTKEEMRSLEDFLNQRYLSAKPISNLNATFLEMKMVLFVET